MTGEVSVRFWQPAPEAGTELLGAYLETSEAPAHLHEEWQFGVLEAPSKLSLGAFQRTSAQPGEVTQPMKLLAPSDAPGDVRETRLRHEHAYLYPGCPANAWVPATDAAAYIRELGILKGRNPAGSGSRRRWLDEEHSEFRGGKPRTWARRAHRSRITDRGQLR